MHRLSAAFLSLAVGAAVAALVGDAPRAAQVGPAPHRARLQVTAQQLAVQAHQLDVASASIAAVQKRARALEDTAAQLRAQTSSQENVL